MVIVVDDLVFWLRFFRTPAEDRRSIQLAVAIVFPIAAAVIGYICTQWLVQLSFHFLTILPWQAALAACPTGVWVLCAGYFRHPTTD